MRSTSLLVFVSLLGSCQSGSDKPAGSDVSPLVSTAAAGAIAGDLAGRLAEQIGPVGATPPLRVRNDDSEYAKALDAALKGWGYVVIADGSNRTTAKAVQLSSGLQNIDGQILAYLTTPSIAVGRTYTITPDGAVPASPVAVMRRD